MEMSALRTHRIQILQGLQGIRKASDGLDPQELVYFFVIYTGELKESWEGPVFSFLSPCFHLSMEGPVRLYTLKMLSNRGSMLQKEPWVRNQKTWVQILVLPLVTI